MLITTSEGNIPTTFATAATGGSWREVRQASSRGTREQRPEREGAASLQMQLRRRLRYTAKRSAEWAYKELRMRQIPSQTALPFQRRRLKTFSGSGRPEKRRAFGLSTKWTTVCKLCHHTIVFATTTQIVKGRVLCPCLEKTYNSWRNMIQRCTNKES